MNKLTEQQIESLKEILKTKKINVNLDKEEDLKKSLTQLGIDSLSALSLVVAIEEKFNIHLDDDQIAKVKNLKELIDLLSNTLNK